MREGRIVMKHFLIVVDMQKDFVDGALGTPEAQAIVGKVVDCIKGPPGWMLDRSVAAALEQKGYTPVEKLTFGSVLLPRLLYQAAAGETFTMELVGLFT